MAKGDGPLTPEIINPAGSPADRARAYRIRKALRESPDEVPPEDQRWYTEYAENQKTARGASRTHKVQFTEESAEAEGTGDAAAVAAAMAAPQLAKEEGRRYDSLILAAVSSMTAANKATSMAYDMVLKMGNQLLERNNQMETVHLSMLETIRAGHLARTEAEAELIRADAEADANAAAEGPGGIDGMVKELMPVIISELAKRTGAGKTPHK
jgi:hypothetical protein